MRNTQAKEGVTELSHGRTRLLKALLKRQSRQAQEIASTPREWSTAGIACLAASWSQQRLWFIDQLENGSRGYHTGFSLRMDGELRESVLRQALNAVVARHEALRTQFSSKDGDLEQEVLFEAQCPFDTADLSEHDVTAREVRLRQLQAQEASRSFDLRHAPLIRALLIRLSRKQHVLLVTVHHIVCDGWSLDVLLRDLAHFYTALIDGRESALAPLRIQFGDYAQWQKGTLGPAVLERQVAYWRRALAGASELALPTDRPRPEIQSHRGGSIDVTLPGELVAELRALAAAHGLTLFMILYSAWAILLSRLSGQHDVVIGVPVANRQRMEIEESVGFFANTLVLRVDVDGELTLESFLQRVREVTIGAYDNQDMPFEQIVDALRPQRSLDRNPVFQVAFGLQNPAIDEIRLPGLNTRREARHDDSAMFDLLLALEERPSAITGTVSYATDLFDETTIRRWMRSFETVLRAYASGLKLPISNLPILPDEQRRELLLEFNATKRDYPADRSIPQLWAEQVARTPDAVAVIDGTTSITYAELDGAANRLARYLHDNGTQPGECVPIVLPRSLNLLIAQLAVLKVAGTYVPIDPETPAARTAFMIEDCGAKRVISASGASLPEMKLPVHAIDEVETARAIAARAAEDLSRSTKKIPPAYVMYTSGSTGTPKGVLIPHRAVVRLVLNNGYAQLGPRDCMAHISNPAFDAATFEIWGALLNGARILVVPQSVLLDAQCFVEAMRQHGVSASFMTVGLFAQYAEVLSPILNQFRFLLTGGDVVDPGVVARAFSRSRPAHLLNAYGPTECTTFSTTYDISREDCERRTLPIGRPIGNSRVYILDEQRRPVPIGVTGEIYLGGDGVALGYLNRPELNAERFVPDPYSDATDARLYRSGDLGRWRADGNVEFLGRRDGQIKMRGFRIELGEIEAHLARHSKVQNVVVVAREDQPGEKRLVAYVVPAADPAPNECYKELLSELRQHLKAQLPAHMQPAMWVVLERLPLTPNGKVDRRALPDPPDRSEDSEEYVAPVSTDETEMATIWAEVLKVRQVGVADNFFELGGHSIKAVKLAARISERFGVKMTVAMVFRHPTVREMARCVATLPREIEEFEEGVL